MISCVKYAEKIHLHDKQYSTDESIEPIYPLVNATKKEDKDESMLSILKIKLSISVPN